jgi:hypothetical protein
MNQNSYMGPAAELASVRGAEVFLRAFDTQMRHIDEAAVRDTGHSPLAVLMERSMFVMLRASLIQIYLSSSAPVGPTSVVPRAGELTNVDGGVIEYRGVMFFGTGSLSFGELVPLFRESKTQTQSSCI